MWKMPSLPVGCSGQGEGEGEDIRHAYCPFPERGEMSGGVSCNTKRVNVRVSAIF